MYDTRIITAAQLAAPSGAECDWCQEREADSRVTVVNDNGDRDVVCCCLGCVPDVVDSRHHGRDESVLVETVRVPASA